MLLGMIALALPTTGCATFGHHTDPAPAPAKQAAATPSLPEKFPQGGDAEVSVFLAQAQTARAGGDFETAAKLLTQLVLIAPDEPRVLGEYGKTLAAQGRSEDALAFLQRAIELQPGDWTLYSAQGVAFDQEAKYQAAQAAYGRALALKPGEAVVLNNDALSHMQAGDLNGAEDLLAQVSPQSPGYPQIAKTLALLATYKVGDHAAVVSNTSPKIADTKPETLPAPMALAPALPPAATPLAAALPPPTPVATEQLTPPEKNDIALESRPAALVEINTPPAKSEPAAKPAQASATFAKPVVSNYEALKADPTVVMAPLPVEAAQPTTRPVVAAKAKPVAATLSDKADAENQPQPVAALAAGKPKAIPANLTVKSEPEKSSGATAARVYVQAGAYLSEERAKQGASGLESLDVKIMQAAVNGRDMFRVRIGPFATMDEAKSAFAQAQALGRTDLLIVKE